MVDGLTAPPALANGEQAELEAPPAEPEPAAVAPRVPRLGRIVLESAGIGLAAILIAAVILNVFAEPLSTPSVYEGDASFYLMLVTGLDETGSYLTNDNLGYPYGQDLHDLPHGGDNLNLAVLRFIGLFAAPSTTVNVFYLLTFGAVAAVAYGCLRAMRIRPLIGAPLALVYAFLPYHMQRGVKHLLLSSYALVPLIVVFSLAVLSDRPPVVERRNGRLRPRFDARTWLVLAGCAGLASTGTYYAVFAVVLFGIAGVFAAIARRSWRNLVSGAVLAGTVVFVAILNVMPSLLYWLRNGTSDTLTSRSPGQTEVFGIRLQQLFSPRVDHRNSLLARLGEKAFHSPVLSEHGHYLGVVLGIAILGLIGLGVVSILRRSEQGWLARSSGTTLRHTTALLVVTLLLAVNGGFSYFISVMGLREIRSWNRIVVVIAFLGIVGLAVVGEAWARRLQSRRGERATRYWLAGVGLVVLGVAWYDQTAPVDNFYAGASKVSWQSDADFFGSMADTLPAGSPVFQFPQIDFPDAFSVGLTGGHDPARAYVHAPGLKWAYGFAYGRHPDWPDDLPSRSGPELVQFLRDAGFHAVVVDRSGYPNRKPELEGRLAEVVPPAGSSSDGRYVWFDLGA